MLARAFRGRGFSLSFSQDSLPPALSGREAINKQTETADNTTSTFEMIMLPIHSSSEKKTPISIRLASLLLCLIALFCTGCQTTKTVAVSEKWVSPARGCLGPGDVVKLTFSGNSEFNQIQRVRADGKISLPVVGEIIADGKRPGDFQRELCGLYKNQLQNNEVVVAVESNIMPVYVSGFVNKPGKIMIDRPTTVLEAIMEAGGFQPGYSNPRKVILLHSSNGKHIPCKLDLSAALKGREMDAVYVSPNDVIYVPESIF